MRVSVAVAILLAAYSSTTVRAQPGSSQSLKTVFLVVMENHNWADIHGSRSAPYINHLLRRSDISYATQYYTPSGNHPSLPNYVWLEAGTNFGISDDNSPSSHTLHSRLHLTSYLDRSRISWRAYEEGIDGSGCPMVDSGNYAVKHDPFVYFTDVSGRPQYCKSHIRPYSQLVADLTHTRVARYNFIVPNLCNDMHDSCAPQNDAVGQGDRWLAHIVPRILNSDAYRRGGVLFIVWDEGANDSDGPIPMMVLSRFAKGHGYHNKIRYTHSSMLRTVEEILHVRPFLGKSSGASDLRDLFLTLP